MLFANDYSSFPQRSFRNEDKDVEVVAEADEENICEEKKENE